MMIPATSIRSAGLGVVLAGLALPAFAGGMGAPVVEPPVMAPAPAPAPMVNGDWTGPWMGLDLGTGRSSTSGIKHNGSVYGLSGGYDYDFGQWVVGGALSWDKSNIDLGPAPGKLKDVARLSLRAGADLGPTLVYGTVGAARASADIGGQSLHDTGWTAGIGADYRLNDRWTLGGEVLTDHFKKFGGTASDVNDTTARLTVGLRF